MITKAASNYPCKRRLRIVFVDDQVSFFALLSTLYQNHILIGLQMRSMHHHSRRKETNHNVSTPSSQASTQENWLWWEKLSWQIASSDANNRLDVLFVQMEFSSFHVTLAVMIGSRCEWLVCWDGVSGWRCEGQQLCLQMTVTDTSRYVT